MIQDVDEDERAASFRVEARERRGQGTAAATITTRLAAEDGSTRVSVETDLEVTGRQAQLGRGIMEDVAGGGLERFAQGLGRGLAGGGPAGGGPAAAAGGGPALGGAGLGPPRGRGAAV